MGFVPISTTDGADYHGKLREVEIGSGVANTFLGDMMNLSGTGSADGRAEGVVLATAGTGNRLAGAIAGFTPDFTDEGTLIRNYHLTGAAQRAKLVYGSDVIYEAPAITALAITDIGTNRNYAAGAGGSTITGLSTHGIGAADTAATDQLRILGTTRTEDDDAPAITAVGAIWRCRINYGVDDHEQAGA